MCSNFKAWLMGGAISESLIKDSGRVLTEAAAHLAGDNQEAGIIWQDLFSWHRPTGL
jgi:hypothetical protein